MVEDDASLEDRPRELDLVRLTVSAMSKGREERSSWRGWARRLVRDDALVFVGSCGTTGIRPYPRQGFHNLEGYQNHRKIEGEE